MFVAPNQKLSVDMVVFFAVSQRTDIVKDKNIIIISSFIDMSGRYGRASFECLWVS